MTTDRKKPVRLTARRRPKLRLVSPSLTTPRHLMPLTFGEDRVVAVRFLLEAWTDEEWAALSPAERPEKVFYMLGFGWLTATLNPSNIEWENALETREEERARIRIANGDFD